MSERSHRQLRHAALFAVASLLVAACSRGPLVPDGASAATEPDGPPPRPAVEDAGNGTTATPASSSTVPTDDGLVWSDEFDGDALGPDWGLETPLLGSGDASVHIYQPEAISVGEGVLRIEATRLPEALQIDDDSDGVVDRTITWQSGFITTRGHVEFLHGRFEARARAPEGQGLWPAIWLRPLDRVYGWWPRSGEIDVMEMLGHDPGTAHTTAHWWNDGHRFDPLGHPLTPTDDGFHVFALEWTPDELVWTIDGEEVRRLDEWTTDLGDGAAPFDQAFYLNINLAVGGSWPGDPDDTTPDGAAFEVDWIRVYQTAEHAGQS